MRRFVTDKQVRALIFRRHFWALQNIGKRRQICFSYCNMLRMRVCRPFEYGGKGFAWSTGLRSPLGSGPEPIQSKAGYSIRGRFDKPRVALTTTILIDYLLQQHQAKEWTIDNT